MVDVIGIIHSMNNIENLTGRGRSEQSLTRLLITIIHQSKYSVPVTLWNQLALSFAGSVGQVVALHGVKVGRFWAKFPRTLSTAATTQIEINPDAGVLATRTAQLLAWSQAHLPRLEFFLKQPHHHPRLVALIPKCLHEEQWSYTYGIIVCLSSVNNHFYKSCGYQGCTTEVKELLSPSTCGLVEKDVQQIAYHCPKCNRTSTTYTPRLLIRVKVKDFTGSIWLAVFQENVQLILQASAEQLYRWHKSDLPLYTKLCNSKLLSRPFRFEMHSIQFESNSFHTTTRLDPLPSDLWFAKLSRSMDACSASKSRQGDFEEHSKKKQIASIIQLD